MVKHNLYISSYSPEDPVDSAIKDVDWPTSPEVRAPTLAPVVTMGTPSWPSSPQSQGAYVVTTLRNIYNSGDDGDCFGRVVDHLGNVLTTADFSLVSGQTLTSVSMGFPMPAYDITIYAQCGYNGTVTDTKGPVTMVVETVPEPPPGVPYTIIEDFVVPDSLPAGANVTASILLRNIGELGRLDYYVDGNPLNPGNYMFVGGGGAPDVPPGGSVWVEFTSPFPMPAWDYTLITTNEDSTSIVTKTIMLSTEGTPTTVTINAPDKVDAGEIFNVFGNLFETATYIRIPGMRINLSYNGKSLGYVYTGPEGDYSFNVSINEGGVWTLKAEFPGTEALQASRSLTDAVVAISPLEAAVAIVGSAATGLTMLAYGLS